MPLQDTYVAIESLEETIRRAFRRQRDGVVADLLRGLPVLFVRVHARAERMREELAAEADAEHRNLADGRLDERQLVALGRKVFVHAHRAAHDDERRVLRDVRDFIAFPPPNYFEADLVIAQVAPDVPVAFVGNVVEHEDGVMIGAHAYRLPRLRR